jgi:cell division protein FtsB
LNLDDQAEEVRSGKGRKEDGGGSVKEYRTEDPLFRKFMMATWAFFALVFMSMQIWLVSNVADIKATLPRFADKDAQIDAHQASADKRIDKLEDRNDALRAQNDALRSRLDQIDGRGMRGGQESTRGK